MSMSMDAGHIIDPGKDEIGAEGFRQPTSPRFFYRWSIIFALGLWIIMAAVFGFWLGSRATSTPNATSAEVGFARDMMLHHANAVEMAILLYDRTDDAEMRTLALDIILTQQAQIGQTRGWLDMWQQPVARLELGMAWMDTPMEGLMPGMASAEQIEHLRNLRGREADGIFLNLMIPHHQAGIAMADAILARTQRPEVRALAESIRTAQASEIEAMQDLLRRKGFPVEELEPLPMHHEGSDE
jgi:uncharacterized protein (DUF305 family)